MMLFFEAAGPRIGWCLWGAGGTSRPRGAAPVEGALPGPDRPGDLHRALDEAGMPDAAVYLLANGGTEIVQDLLPLTAEALERVGRCCATWPESNGALADVARTWSGRLPQVPHYVASETAFFAGLPDVARLYALPELQAARDGATLPLPAFRRFGAHGFCHAWVWAEAQARLGPGARRLVSVYLGDAPDVAALRDGRALETTAGFTTTEGLISASRPGELDPDIVAILLGSGLAPADLRRLLCCESGLAALIGPGAGLKDALASGAPGAARARRVLLHQLLKAIGGCLAVLGGADGLAFAVPEADASVDAFVDALCASLAFVGVRRAGEHEPGALADGAIPALVLPYVRWDVLARRVAARMGKE
jgi:acetate kinase